MKNKTSKLYYVITFVILTLFGVQLHSQCDDSASYWNSIEYSCMTQDNPNPIREKSHWVVYEFEGDQKLDSSFGWNDVGNPSMNIGAKEVMVDYTMDGKEWIEWGVFEFSKAPEKNQYQGFSGPNFRGITVKKILISVISTHKETSCPFIPELDFGVDAQIKSSKEQNGLPSDKTFANVFPNPVKSYLNIDIEKKLVEGAKIHLLDTNGREMLTSNHLLLEENQMIQLNIENCLPGLLVLVIQSGNEIYTHKILKV